VHVRRELNALLERYRREPSIKDIFVEGSLDQTLVRSFLRWRGLASTGVLPIRSIRIPNQLLLDQEYGSDKGRLMALARYLEEELGAGVPPVRCIVDRDFEDLLGVRSVGSSNLILRTDLASMDMYFFNRSLLERVLVDFVGISDLDTDLLLGQIGSVLMTVSVMFAANRSLGLECSHIQLRRCTKYDRESGIRFDDQEYLVRYLNKGAAMGQRREFESEMHRISAMAPTDPRRWVRGRDFLPLLSYVMRKHGVSQQRCTPSILEGAFTLAADLEYLEKFHLFRTLRCWH